MSPEVEEVVALDDVVVVAVAVPRASGSAPSWRSSSGLAPSLSESVDSPVNGMDRIWLARCGADKRRFLGFLIHEVHRNVWSYVGMYLRLM
jgi:hypothetical protein